MPYDELTGVQRSILLTIRALTAEYGRSPTMREVLGQVRLKSLGALAHQYKQLETRGLLRRDPGRPRTVMVRLPGEPDFRIRQPPAPEPPNVVQVQLTGLISAGLGIRSEELADGYVSLPTELVGRQGGLFIREIRGDSMIGAGIFDGDWVVIRPLTGSPRDGDIVAATIDGVEVEGTVKTYKKVGRQVWLMPQNPAYTPVPGNEARNFGQVIAVLRRVTAVR